MSAVVVTGEALIDLVVGVDGSLAAHPGGGPYNVARTLGRLGAPVAYLGGLSTDRFGRSLRSELERDGVVLDWAASVDVPTTLALAELDAAGAASYRFYSEGTSAAELVKALPPDVDVLYLGTLGLVLEPLATSLEMLDVPADALVALDPNCRPSAIAFPAAYRERLARLLARADVLKVSEDDLAWLSPGVDAVPAARALLRDGAVALVTLGEQGAAVVTAAGEVAIAPVPVSVVDTIGAGDAFMGGFLAAWHPRGRAELGDLEAVAEAARFAARVAAITCSRAGADPPHRAEL